MRIIICKALRSQIQKRFGKKFVRPLVMLSFFDPQLAMEEQPHWVWDPEPTRGRQHEERTCRELLKKFIMACNTKNHGQALRTLGANTDAALRQPNSQDTDGAPSFPPLSTVQLAPDLPA